MKEQNIYTKTAVLVNTRTDTEVEAEVADLKENVEAVLDTLAKARPETLKGHQYVKSASLSGTMTPGVKLEQSLYAKL